MVSTASALIEAARQAGTLDQLAQEAGAAADQKADQKVENAEVLFLLIELARGNGAKIAPRIEARLAELKKENEAHVAAMAPRAPGGSTAAVVRSVANRPDRIVFPWTDSLLSSAALRDGDPAVASLGMRLALALEERAKMVNDPAVLARIRGELAQARARQALAPAAAATINLASWHPVSSRSSYQRRSSASPALWVAQEGHVAHMTGPSTDYLLLDYPLTGTYEFTCQAYAGPWADSVLTHGGLVVEPFTVAGRGGSSIFSGRAERITSDSLAAEPRGRVQPHDRPGHPAESPLPGQRPFVL